MNSHRKKKEGAFYNIRQGKCSMASKVLSIEVGYGITKVVEMDHKAKKPKVYHCFSFPTPVNLVDDGMVQPNQMFRAVLKRECTNRGIKTNKVVFTVTSSKMATREVNIPLVKEVKIKDVLMTNIQDYFPVDISMYQISYTILEKINTKEKKEYRLLVIATPQILIRSYRRLAQICGMELVDLNYTGNSVYELAKANYKEGTNLVLKIEEKASQITILKDGVLDLQRTITYGMDDAIEVLMRGKNFEPRMKYDEAIDTLRKDSCIASRLESEEEEEPLEDDLSILQKEVAESLRYMIGSILRVMDYYVSVKKVEKFDRIILVGLGSDFKGLIELLSTEINQKVIAITQLENASIPRELAGQSFNLGEYVANFGAVIKPLQVIGDEVGTGGKQAKDKKESNSIVGYLLLGLGIVSSVGLLGFGVVQQKNLKEKNESLQAEVARLQPILKVHSSYNQLKKDYEGFLGMYQSTLNPNEELLAFIQELEQKLPTQANVVSIDANTQGVNMNLEMKTKEEAATVLLELQTFKSLLNVSATSLTEKQDELGNVTISMPVTCEYRPVDDKDAKQEGNEGEAQAADAEQQGQE